MHVATQRRGLAVQIVQRTVKCPQSHRLERVVHVPVVVQRQGPTVQPVQACCVGTWSMISSCDEPLGSSGPPQSATSPMNGIPPCKYSQNRVAERSSSKYRGQSDKSRGCQNARLDPPAGFTQESRGRPNEDQVITQIRPACQQSWEIRWR